MGEGKVRKTERKEVKKAKVGTRTEGRKVEERDE